MNPVYLRVKGTMTTRQAIEQIGRNVLANIVKSARPNPMWTGADGSSAT